MNQNWVGFYYLYLNVSSAFHVEGTEAQGRMIYSKSPTRLAHCSLQSPITASLATCFRALPDGQDFGHAPCSPFPRTMGLAGAWPHALRNPQRTTSLSSLCSSLTMKIMSKRDKMVGMKSMLSSPFVSSQRPNTELAAARTEQRELRVVVIPA